MEITRATAWEPRTDLVHAIEELGITHVVTYEYYIHRWPPDL